SRHYIVTETIPEDLRSAIHFTNINVDTRIKPLSLLLNFLFSRLPYNATRFDNPSFMQALINKLKTEKYDIVQLEGLYLKPYIPVIRKFHSGIIAYRAHNVESEIWYKLADHTHNLLKRYYLRNLARRIDSYERDMINQYDILLAITD